MSAVDISEESKLAKDCALNLFVGKQIGSGSYRNVYEFVGFKEKVLKIEYSGREFCNVTEKAVWNAVEGTPIEQWFAPCYQIDLVGIALVQARTEPFESDEAFRAAIKKLPGKRLPDFLDDIHYGNFGMFQGRLVCHDYAFNNFLADGVKVGWKDEQAKEEKREKRRKGKK